MADVQEKVVQIQGMPKWPEVGVARASSSKAELERVQREKEIAARSLSYPSLQSPDLFSLFSKAPSSDLGKKISDLSEIDTATTRLVSKQALPPLATTNSIYDIVPAEPEPAHLAEAIDQAKNQLQEMSEQTLERAKQAKDPEEILASVEEMVDILGRPQEKLIEEAVKKGPFPNLALEIITLGLKIESRQTKQLSEYKQEGDGYRKKISQLIDLSSRLPKITSENPTYNVEETKKEIVESHEKLKTMGIDIFPGMTIDSELSKEQLAAANSLINHHIDVNRTSLQELFSTKISVVIQFMSMLGEVMKKIIEKDNHLKEKTNRLPNQ